MFERTMKSLQFERRMKIYNNFMRQYSFKNKQKKLKGQHNNQFGEIEH
jgi:hypothetical protein